MVTTPEGLMAEYHRVVDPCLREPITWALPEPMRNLPPGTSGVTYPGVGPGGVTLLVIRWAEGERSGYDGTAVAGNFVTRLLPAHSGLLGARAEAEAPAPVTKT